MDDYVKRILRALVKNGRMTWLELADLVALSPSAVQRRVQALQQAGYIHNFSVQLDQAAMGNQVRAFVQVKVERHKLDQANEFRRAVLDYPEVQSCHKLAGSVDYMLDVITADLGSFGVFIETKLLSMAGVTDASSYIVLDEVKPFTPYV